ASFYHLGRPFRHNAVGVERSRGLRHNKVVSYVTEDPNVAIGANGWKSRINVQKCVGFSDLWTETVEINPGLDFTFGRTENSLDNRVQSITGWTPTLIG